VRLVALVVATELAGPSWPRSVAFWSCLVRWPGEPRWPGSTA